MNRGVGRRKAQALLWLRFLHLPISLSLALCHTDSGWKSLSQPLKRWTCFLEVKNKSFWGEGVKKPISQHGGSEGRRNSLTGFSSQREGGSEEMRFQLCKARKTLLTLSICKQEDLSRFRTFFFVYYLNSLLCVCFLYWQHFLSWVSVICRK